MLYGSLVINKVHVELQGLLLFLQLLEDINHINSEVEQTVHHIKQ